MSTPIPLTHIAEAERMILGGIIIQPEHTHTPLIFETLKPQHFSQKMHTLIYREMLKMFLEGVPIDMITLFDQIQRDGLTDKLGGWLEVKTYVSTMILDVSHVTNLGYYALILLRKYQLQQVGLAAGEIQETASEGKADPDELLDEAIMKLTRISIAGRTQGPVSAADAASDVLETIEKISTGELKTAGISTGFSELDEFIHGFHPGELIIIGARPSIGKSALCLDLARNVAAQGYGASIFSLEMRREELCNRLLSAMSGIGLTAIRKGNLSDNKRARLALSQARLGELPIILDDSPTLRPAQLLAKARVMCAQENMGALFIDYLQLMDVAREKDSRQQEIATISRGLKRIARELSITVVAFSQLSREVEKLKRAPILPDLKESGALEQDADVVIFLHREKKSKEVNQEIEGIVAKQRNGPCGTFKLMFQRAYTSFKDATPDWVKGDD